MLSKASGLSKQLLTRSTKIINTSISLANLSSSRLVLKQTNLIPKQAFCLPLNKFHSSSFLFSEKTQNQSILGTQAPKTALADEFKNILDKQTTDEQKSDQKTASEEGPTGENEKKSRFAQMFSREHAWKVSLTFFTAMFGGSLLYVLVNWGSPKLDENNNPIKDEYSDLPVYFQYPKRALKAVFDYYESIKDPSVDKLLPDPIQPPYYQPPYTLVIEMTGIMLHPEWTFNTGWRYKKRPGLDYFIEQVKYPLFEVVLFTREPFLSGAPIAASLDPQQNIHHKLFRENTKFIDNNYVKDLSYLNRDVSKIILIDWDEKAYSLQPRNALHRLKKWDGDETDTDLVYLASFLKMIAASGVNDVREVLDYYNQEPNPLEAFKIKQIQLQEAELERKQVEEEMRKKKAKQFSLFRR